MHISSQKFEEKSLSVYMHKNQSENWGIIIFCVYAHYQSEIWFKIIFLYMRITSQRLDLETFFFFFFFVYAYDAIKMNEFIRC